VFPVILALLFLLVFLLSDNPFIALPWGYVNALKASVLYSTIDTSNFKPEAEQENVKWTRGSSPYYENDEAAHVRPRYDRGSRSFSWNLHQPENNLNGDEAPSKETRRVRGSLPTIDAKIAEPNISKEGSKEIV